MKKPNPLDNIPDEIEVGGKRYPVDKEGYKKFALAAGQRVLIFSKMGPMKISLGGKDLALLDMKKFVKIDPDGEGTTIQLGEPGPKVEQGLVGMGGLYYHPRNIGANSVDEVIESWNWLFERNDFPKIDFENMLEGDSILYWIRTGQNQMAVFYIMSLAVDLKQLFDVGIDIEEKISELMSKIKGNWKKFKKLNKTETVLALMHLENLTLTIADMVAETRIAIAAHGFGLDVKMRRTPDVLIDGVRVEAKFDRRKLMGDRSFETKVTKGIKQGGALIAIFTGSLGIKKLKNRKLTWLPTESLETSLLTAIEFCKKGKKCVLLFTGTNKGEIGRMAIIR